MRPDADDGVGVGPTEARIASGGGAAVGFTRRESGVSCIPEFEKVR